MKLREDGGSSEARGAGDSRSAGDTSGSSNSSESRISSNASNSRTSSASRKDSDEPHAPWPMVRLGDVCEFSRGLTYSKSDEVQVSSNVVLRSNNVDLESGHLILDELKYIRDSIEIPTSKRVSKGSILMCTANGSKQHLGKVALIDGEYDYAFGGFMGLLTPNADIDSRYLYWHLVSFEFKRLVTSLTDGTNINNLKFADIAQFTFPLPPLSVQREIVARLERELAAVEKIKKDFEALAETAKAEFKAELKETFEEDCSCEKTWDEVFYTTTGKLDSNCAISDGKYPFFTCSKEVLRINEWAFDCEALLLAGNNAAGKYDVKHYVGKFNAYQRTYVLTLKNADWEYKLFQAQLENLLQYLQDKSKGTGTRYLTMGILRTLRFYVPEPFVQREVVARLDSAKARAEKLEAKAREGVAVCETMRKAILKEAFE